MLKLVFLLVVVIVFERASSSSAHPRIDKGPQHLGFCLIRMLRRIKAAEIILVNKAKVTITAAVPIDSR